MDGENNKLDSLTARIDRAEVAAKPKNKFEPESAGRIGFDFVGSLAGAGILGAIADHAFGTSPWCLIGMVFLGFGVGIWNAWRLMQKSEELDTK
jgi:ATP synthase protein I